MKIRFPHKWTGWKALFWLTLRRCPRDHHRLLADPWSFGNDRTLYCFGCEGVAMWPGGMLEALRQNYRAEAKASLPKGVDA